MIKFLWNKKLKTSKKDFNDFIDFFNYKDQKGRNRNKIVDLFGGATKDQDFLIGELNRFYGEYLKAKEEEADRKARGAAKLINNASDLQAGTYKWNGTAWVRQ